MNPVERAIRSVDATQRRFTPTAFVFGVIKKFGDDNGGVLASNLAYSAFVALFPLLLVLATILGWIASVIGEIRECQRVTHSSKDWSGCCSSRATVSTPGDRTPSGQVRGGDHGLPP